MGIMILSGLVWNDSKRIMDELKEYLSYHAKTGKWCASGCKFGKGHYLGIYKTEIEAAKAYDSWAKEAHGEYANLNGV